MKIVVVGMGVQGNKRKKFLGSDFKYTVDKYKKADFKLLKNVPLNEYDSAMICVPDNQKFELIKYCIVNGKHILIEKPFLLKNNRQFLVLEKLAKRKKVICYTAYNHRFEPALIKMNNLIKNKKIGKIYSARVFYGNGTASLVKKSKWRDKGLGVISDLGSHLIDICMMLFGEKINFSKNLVFNRFENRAPDHAILYLKVNDIKIELEMTLCMWKNTFTCDVIGSNGSAHINSLCKWRKSTFLETKRKFPSGIPNEKITFFKKGDPTWKAEYEYFKNLIKKKKNTNFKKDSIINKSFLNFKKIIL